MSRSWVFVIVSAVLLFDSSSGVGAECGCRMKVPAVSKSESGVCVVLQSRSRFCTLDWRHGADTEIADSNAVRRTQSRVDGFRKFALGGGIPEQNLFAQLKTWQKFEVQVRKGLEGEPPLYRAAASYLERTYPKEYRLVPLLGSIVTLLVSATNKNIKLPAKFLLTYISDNAESLFHRLSGGVSADPEPKDTNIGVIVDGSSPGCFELMWFPKGTKEGFDIRFAVKTRYGRRGPGCS